MAAREGVATLNAYVMENRATCCNVGHMLIILALDLAERAPRQYCPTPLQHPKGPLHYHTRTTLPKVPLPLMCPEIVPRERNLNARAVRVNTITYQEIGYRDTINVTHTF